MPRAADSAASRILRRKSKRCLRNNTDRLKGEPSLEEAACFIRTPSYISTRLYFGFETRDGFNLALPEKALLDAVYFRHIVPFADDLEMDLLDIDRLRQMARSFPLRVRAAVDQLCNYNKCA